MFDVRRRTRREDGAVAVEAALVIPILCLLVFGMIEFSFVMRDYATVASMSRSGTRIASTGADHGPATCETGAAAPPCSPTTSPALAQEAADAIQRSGAAGNSAIIDYILVYESNSKGFPGAEATVAMPTDCSGSVNCVKFLWRPALSQFKYASGTWDSKTISACFPGTSAAPMDRVGVYVHATHPMLTGLFGTSISLEDRTVMDFEPLPTQSCGANDHL